MVRFRRKDKIHIAEFEQDQRKVSVSVEFDAGPKSKRSGIILLLKFILFPILLPFRIIWFFIRNIIND